VILLGSNIDPERYLHLAVNHLSSSQQIIDFSSVWETPPYGAPGPNFLNAAVRLRTSLTAGLLKTQILHPIEIQLGRVRSENKYAPRTIDLDILVFDGQVMEPGIWKNVFSAVPLAELEPDLAHPDTGKTLRMVAVELSRFAPVTKRADIRLG
jgi:2-amino-4-hydroxy-6-hydroxymethyldihydropteridine diphosphokinase